ncbi:MAG: MBL fold metallo-hydrolase, partial [Bacteroidetes bacterium]|nr:MBL fold metallo-hydrolase [Bacteroidota bacterium]
MKILLCLLCLFCSLATIAQPDVIPAKNGDISIHPILHGSMVLEWKNKTIYVDPYGGADKYVGHTAPDLVLITDIHGDHL